MHKETQQHLKKPANKPNINHTYQIHHPHKRPPLHVFEDDPSMAEISSLQTKEVENYRSAMSKMADDIIELRTQVVTLEAENSRLRIDRSLHQDLDRDHLNDSDIETMTNAEISKHIASLKLKVASEIRKAASQRERIQQLQNDLIKKNDSEKELLKLQRVHKLQLDDQQNCLVKMASLEGTVKQQEKVIEEMEKALESKLSGNDKQSGDNRLMVKKQRGENDKRKEEIESALAAENTRLREELDRFHQQPNPVFIQQSEQTKDAMPLNERLRLLHKVEQAEARVQTLEAQLEENSKQWGREKQEMMTKLSEHKHGFFRTSTTIFHNDPSRSKSGSLYQQSRERSQKPIK
ncbi:coiled-coil domain-containing protein 33 isoform X1 [Labrus bergylta]|uniref:coiled-coil domain-containing protein 33 isoform X1 n=1 Tax=Labrus bergylta TaxID=56723 RepID=UPI00331397B6